VGSHTVSFPAALRSTLREDPDVILVGEMRDLDTISFAVSAAETGHLVLATVHTVSAETTMDRLIDAFPVRAQQQVRAQISGTLKAVLCQQLLRRKDGKGRVAAVEILLNNDAVANIIRKGQCFQLPSVVATSREQGMRSMDHELMRLYKDGLVDADEVYVKSLNKKELEAFLAEQGEAERAPARGSDAKA
jgi:twitching motility protein PilT